MNRRQRRALAKKFPGYKKLLKESIGLTFNEFQEMLRKNWEKEELINSEKNDTAAESTEIEENETN